MTIEQKYQVEQDRDIWQMVKTMNRCGEEECLNLTEKRRGSMSEEVFMLEPIK